MFSWIAVRKIPVRISGLTTDGLQGSCMIIFMADRSGCRIAGHRVRDMDGLVRRRFSGMHFLIRVIFWYPVRLGPGTGVLVILGRSKMAMVTGKAGGRMYCPEVFICNSYRNAWVLLRLR